MWSVASRWIRDGDGMVMWSRAAVWVLVLDGIGFIDAGFWDGEAVVWAEVNWVLILWFEMAEAMECTVTLVIGIGMVACENLFEVVVWEHGMDGGSW
ncbi:hypothetical protein M0R45_036301 [Rubus argutus]|uniref:NADH dehydrogenase subunit 6 n=1 Tax=Rubus argutus TaxID=59490 RepID=A0AAW1VWL9_RUBAR